MLLETIKNFAKTIGPRATKIISILDKDGETMDKTLPQPFAGEMRGISNTTGLHLGEIVLYNIFYEVFSVCTSIIAEDPSGKLFHARNLDFGLLLGWDLKNDTWAVTEVLRPLVVNIDYQKQEKTVFRAVHFAGYIGILTGIKPGIFTLTMNERFGLDGGYIVEKPVPLHLICFTFLGILEWLLGKRTGQWMGFLTRNTLENAISYEEAKDMLSKTEMLAPAYYILGGNSSGQGCVITRSREKADDVWEMKNANGWYILETNYDHWTAPLVIDDRRTPAHMCMKNLTQQLTTYTALMQVDKGHLETWIQYCPDPCWPW
ncbi:hypothetical protein KUTeg_025000 [Tegillarca granosa]|uniref:ceramidase n=1 Tax=Tegillarca granosa TaxID=220873 RepID=A0ABQ9E2U6_TEGGR|nr:hypothetical protein KUTeg_025000 [Tegillarca granosa]